MNRPPLIAGPVMTDLLSRLEAAGGPDRELDALICARFRLLTVRAMSERWVREWAGTVEARGSRVYLVHTNGSLGMWSEAAPITASLDAAVALIERVLPDYQIKLHIEPAVVYACVFWNDVRAFPAEAPTAPLALISAMVRAMPIRFSTHDHQI